MAAAAISENRYIAISPQRLTEMTTFDRVTRISTTYDTDHLKSQF